MKFNFTSNHVFVKTVYHQKFCKKKQKHKNYFFIILEILLCKKFNFNAVNK